MTEQPAFSNEEYQNYVQRLADLVYNELVPKIALLDYFTVHAYEHSPSPEEIEPLLWFVNSGLHYDTTFSLYRLVYPKQSDRNIVHFLNVTKQNFNQIEWADPFQKASIDKHLADWASKSETTGRLVTRRNKFFAHYDKDYFYDPDKLSVEVPFSVEDAKDLVRLLQNTISFYHYHLFGSRRVSLEGFVYSGADQLYQLLKKNHAERLTRSTNP
jgi:hypothetical protein